MPIIASLTSFTANTKAKAAEVNANFSAIRTTVNTYGVFTDVAATITAVHTFTGVPIFSNGATVTSGGITITAGGLMVAAGGVTIAAGGASIGGNATVSGTLGVTGLTTVTTLTSSGLATLASGSVTGVLGVGGLLTASAGLTVTGTATATTFSGSGASLTNLPAANLTGTIAAISGVNLTNLNGSNIASGTVAIGRLPTSPTFSGTVEGTTSIKSAFFTGVTSAADGKFTPGSGGTFFFDLEPNGVSGSTAYMTNVSPGAISAVEWLRVKTASGTRYIELKA